MASKLDKMLMVISVIIPFYKNVGTLRQVLDGLRVQTLPQSQYEVIVVDDGATEPLDDMAVMNWPFQLFILRQANQGPASARNNGAGHARGDILLFIDSDMIPDTGLVAAHYKVHTDKGRSLFYGAINGWYGDNLSFADEVLEAGEDGRRHHVPANDAEVYPLSFYRVDSGHFSVRKELFEELNGFDENFRGCEDIELAYRAQLMGLEVFFVPGAISYHHHSRNTLIARLERNRKYTSYRPYIIEKHPEIARHIPGWNEELPIGLQDTPGLLKRKLKVRFFAWLPIRLSLLGLARLLEHFRIQPRLFSFAYWRLLSAYDYLGFQDGVRRMQHQDASLSR